MTNPKSEIRNPKAWAVQAFELAFAQATARRGLLLALLWLTFPLSAWAQDRVPPPAASQAEVNAGTVGNKYISPSTLQKLLSGTPAPDGWTQSNNVYYVNPMATNVPMVKGSSILPYHTLDQVGTNAAGNSATVFLVEGTHFFGNAPLTNCSVLGLGNPANIIVLCSNAGLNSAVSSVAFVCATNFLTYSNFTFGFTFGGLNCTNFSTPFYVPAAAPMFTNTISRVFIPIAHAGFDGIYSDGLTNETWNFVTNAWDEPWDNFNWTSGSRGIKTLFFSGGGYTNRGIPNVVNTTGLGHGLWFQSALDGSAATANGTTFVALQITNAANQFAINITANHAFKLALTNCVCKNNATNLDVNLVGAGFSVTGLNASIVGGIFDTNSIVSSAKWTNTLNYVEWFGNIVNYIQP